MKRLHKVFLAGAVSFALAGAVQGQGGPSLFPRPSIAGVIHPEVGKGAVYETTRGPEGSATKETQEMTVVGLEKVDGREGFWFEFVRPNPQTGKPTYGKILFTKDDFQIHRLVVQRDGQAAIEIPFHPDDAAARKLSDGASKWQPVGAETVTVPGGTFVCQHWKSSGNEGGEIWTSELVSPFGLVKEVTANRTMVLVKLIADATDHISGPVKTIDPAAMRQQILDRTEQQAPQPPNR